MPVQDLTPQLRTRLSRVERAVGFFVTIATLLLLAGFAYYIYHTAERKGWFLTKARYFTFVDNAAGLSVGDPIHMMGFNVGHITQIEPQPPTDVYYNVYIEFEVQDPYYGYLWTGGSRARVASSDFLGHRSIEVTKGTNGFPTYVFYQIRDVTPAEAQGFNDLTNYVFLETHEGAETNQITVPLQPVTTPLLKTLARAGVQTVRLGNTKEKNKKMTGIFDEKQGKYDVITKDTKPYWLLPDEAPALAQRMEGMADQVQKALPIVLNMTNQLAQVLSNATTITSNANKLLVTVGPAVTNLNIITTMLKDPNGSLGNWLIPTNLNAQLVKTLAAADQTLTNATTVLATADTNLTTVALSLDKTLENLANLTSNLNAQVAANTNLVSNISTMIVHSDEMVQGLKKHWLLRSAFKSKTNAPAKVKARSGKEGKR